MEVSREALDSPRLEPPRGEPVQRPEEVAAMLRLHDLRSARSAAQANGCEAPQV